MELIILQTLAAAAGTFAFSVLFGVPRRYEFYCGVIGGAGWFVYALLLEYAHMTPAGATFIATVVLTLLSRCAAVIEKCKVQRDGLYVSMIVSENADKITDIYRTEAGLK